MVVSRARPSTNERLFGTPGIPNIIRAFRVSDRKQSHECSVRTFGRYRKYPRHPPNGTVYCGYYRRYSVYIVVPTNYGAWTFRAHGDLSKWTFKDEYANGRLGKTWTPLDKIVPEQIVNNKRVCLRKSYATTVHLAGRTRLRYVRRLLRTERCTKSTHSGELTTVRYRYVASYTGPVPIPHDHPQIGNDRSRKPERPPTVIENRNRTAHSVVKHSRYYSSRPFERPAPIITHVRLLDDNGAFGWTAEPFQIQRYRSIVTRIFDIRTRVNRNTIVLIVTVRKLIKKKKTKTNNNNGTASRKFDANDESPGVTDFLGNSTISFGK